MEFPPELKRALERLQAGVPDSDREAIARIRARMAQTDLQGDEP